MYQKIIGFNVKYYGENVKNVTVPVLVCEVIITLGALNDIDRFLL